MTRKAIAVCLSIMICFSLCTNVSAVEAATPSTMESYTFVETATEIRVVVYANDGETMYIAVEKREPSVIYQWRRLPEENESLAVENKREDALGIDLLKQKQDCEIYEVAYSDMNNHSRSLNDISGAQLQAVEDWMIDKYGEPRAYVKTYTDTNSYSPLIVRIYETDYVSPIYCGKADVGTAVTLAGAAASIAATFAVPYAAAVAMVCDIAGAADSMVNALRAFSMYIFRASYLTERAGVIVDNGEEIPVHSATRTYWRYFAFEEEPNGSVNASDYIIESGECDTIYVPSQYEFRYDRLVEDTYEIYAN